MPRKLQYQARRTVTLPAEVDAKLIEIAKGKKTTPAGLSRDYVVEGVERHVKSVRSTNV